MVTAVIIFILVYAGLILGKKYRPQIAWLGVAAGLLLGALKITELATGVNWNVIGILVGSLLLAELFILSRVPETVSDKIINHSPNVGMAFMAVIACSSFLSIFIDNVVTVLIVAPIALQLARKTDVSPVPVIIGLALASNLQGVAILIGDTPSMILAARMRMNFLEFFWYQGKPGIFFLVEVGALVSFFALYFIVGQREKSFQKIAVTPVKTWMPAWMIVVMIVTLSLAQYVDPDFEWFGGVSCMFLALLALLMHLFASGERAWPMVRNLDWSTVMFLIAIFLLVNMLEERGAIGKMVEKMRLLSHLSPFIVFTAVVWISVIISAFIDNIPYVTAMLPIVIGFSEGLEMPPALLVFGVLIGACLGGNITPIGASANIVAVGILDREGHHTSFSDFLKIGITFTLAATIPAYLLLWFIYGTGAN